MSATISVFPITRDPRPIKRTAQFMLQCSAAHAEKHLAYTVRRRAEGLIQRGIPANLALSQAKAFEAAVRIAVWRLEILGDDGEHDGGAA